MSGFSSLKTEASCRQITCIPLFTLSNNLRSECGQQLFKEVDRSSALNCGLQDFGKERDMLFSSTNRLNSSPVEERPHILLRGGNLIVDGALREQFFLPQGALACNAHTIVDDRDSTLGCEMAENDNSASAYGAPPKPLYTIAPHLSAQRSLDNPRLVRRSTRATIRASRSFESTISPSPDAAASTIPEAPSLAPLCKTREVLASEGREQHSPRVRASPQSPLMRNVGAALCTLGQLGRHQRSRGDPDASEKAKPGKAADATTGRSVDDCDPQPGGLEVKPASSSAQVTVAGADAAHKKAVPRPWLSWLSWANRKAHTRVAPSGSATTLDQLEPEDCPF